jgi:hypothetical protein
MAKRDGDIFVVRSIDEVNDPLTDPGITNGRKGPERHALVYQVEMVIFEIIAA